MPEQKLKLTQRIFEARFEQGYRYLDRCGDAMILLEKGLPDISDSKVWMPHDVAPTGARMKCPDFDITLVFDAYRLCVDQNPADLDCPFGPISKYALDTVVSKFDILKVERFGNRRLYMLGTDSVDDADRLSLKKAPFDHWLSPESDDIEPRSCNVATMLESKDRSRGVNFSIAPTHYVEAPLTIDPRLRKPPHTLRENQRKVLLDQLRRQKQRREEPVAGLLIDVDCWWLNPDEMDTDAFFEYSERQIANLVKHFLGGSQCLITI